MDSVLNSVFGKAWLFVSENQRFILKFDNAELILEKIDDREVVVSQTIKERPVDHLGMHQEIESLLKGRRSERSSVKMKKFASEVRSEIMKGSAAINGLIDHIENKKKEIDAKYNKLRDTYSDYCDQLDNDATNKFETERKHWFKNVYRILISETVDSGFFVEKTRFVQHEAGYINNKLRPELERQFNRIAWIVFDAHKSTFMRSGSLISDERKRDVLSDDIRKEIFEVHVKPYLHASHAALIGLSDMLDYIDEIPKDDQEYMTKLIQNSIDKCMSEEQAHFSAYKAITDKVKNVFVDELYELSRLSDMIEGYSGFMSRKIQILQTLSERIHTTQVWDDNEL